MQDLFRKLFGIANQKKGMANIPAKDPYGMPYGNAESLLYGTEDPSSTLSGGFKPDHGIYHVPMEQRIKAKDDYLKGAGVQTGEGGNRIDNMYNRSTFPERFMGVFNQMTR